MVELLKFVLSTLFQLFSDIFIVRCMSAFLSFFFPISVLLARYFSLALLYFPISLHCFHVEARIESSFWELKRDVKL